MRFDPTRLTARLSRLDVRAFDAVGRHRSPTLDAVLPRLTRAADHSKLWIALAAGFVAVGDRDTARAGWRGAVTIGAASLLANQVGKRLLPRRRPLVDTVPVGRRARRRPTSSSFPSGHSASAAAFATTVVIERPRLAPLVVPLAAAVGLSRVYTGVHYPGDVLGGLALGVAIGAVGHRVRPLRPEEPVRVVSERPVPQPPRPTGAGVAIVVNPHSGTNGGPDPLEFLAAELPEARLFPLDGDVDVPELLGRAVAAAEVLGVWGGDGTVNAAAAACLEHEVPLLPFPGGTFNHFTADLGIARPGDAVAALAAGRAARVDVGVVETLGDEEPPEGAVAAAGERALFLNTASLGAYPEFVRLREKLEDRVGKPMAAVLAAVRIWRRGQMLRAYLRGERRRIGLMFVGTGAYRPRGMAPGWRPRLDDGRLDLRFIETDRWRDAVLLAGWALVGRLRRSPRYHEVRTTEFVVDLPDGPGRLARDGEVGQAPQRLRFALLPAALTVYSPLVGSPE